MSGQSWTSRHGKAFGTVCVDCRRTGLAIAATKINPLQPISDVERAHYGFQFARGPGQGARR